MHEGSESGNPVRRGGRLPGGPFLGRTGPDAVANNDAVMERLDAEGNVIGFTVMQVSRLA